MNHDQHNYAEILLYTLIITIIISGCAQPEEKPLPFIMRIGHPMAQGNNVTLGYEKFKEVVEKKSQGKIQIKIYPNTLIGNDVVTMKAAQKGELEMASSSTPNMAELSKKFMAFDLPYITSPQHQQRFYEALDKGELRQYLENISADIGLKPIMWSEYGYRNFANTRKPIRTPKDIEGLTIRVTQSPVDHAVTAAAGAKAVTLIWADTYPALVRGTIDGEGNTFSLLYSAKHHEALRYVATTQHNYSMHVLMMNKRYWDGLPRDVQSIIQESAQEALAYERKITNELEESAKTAFNKAGIQVVDLTPEEREQWIKATRPVWNKFRSEIPQELVKLIQNTQK